MGRARGKGQPPRPVTVDPDSPEGRDIGMSKRTQGVPAPIPGGRPHLSNPPTVRHEPPIQAPRGEYRGVNAHGVPPDSHTTRERADLERGGANDIKPHLPAPRKLPEPIIPVPVYVVERGGGGDTYLTAAPHSITVPANGGEPVRLCGRSTNRSRVLLFNEDSSHNARFAQRPGDLISGAGGAGGALLPKAMTSYLALTCQDELWAWSADSSVVAVSIIQEFEQTT